MIFTFIIASVFTACSVKYSFTGASIPLQAKTFSIADFENMAPTVNPTLSSLLTNKLYEKIQSSTSLVNTSFGGDMDFSGTIINYTITPVALQGGEITLAAKNRLTISVQVVFTNVYQPENSYKQTINHYEDFDSALDFMSIEQSLVEEIVDKIVTDIFNKAFVNW
ncbi:MAG TPA: LptE family protein [Salinivirgaceae bacterium]|nr:LptE family protein [Salinivirgaceae bacterium]